MNIIEAIKSGKDFRRKGWQNEFYYLFYHVGKTYIYSTCDPLIKNIDDGSRHIFTITDILSDDWEVKESETNKAEETMAFDPTKPVQNKKKKKATILCTNAKGNFPICALIEDWEGYEYPESFTINGKYYNDEDSDNDLINIEVKKLIDIHFGGIYKCEDGTIGICTNDTQYKRIYLLENNFFSELIDPKDIIEHLGDIKNIHEYIKQKLT